MKTIFQNLKLKIISLSITTSRILAGILVLTYILDLATNYSKYNETLNSSSSTSALIYLASQFLQMLVFATVLVSYSWIADWFLKLVKEEAKDKKERVSGSKIETTEVVESKKKKKK